MPSKRDSTFDALLLNCECYLAIDDVELPPNYRGQVKEIRHAAATSQPHDRAMLIRLKAELVKLSSFWTPEQRAAYQRLRAALQETGQVR
jgi:hypothetical protein